MEKRISLDFAIGTLASKIAKTMKEIRETGSEALEKELNELLIEREELYKGNKEIIKKYGA